MSELQRASRHADRGTVPYLDDGDVIDLPATERRDGGFFTYLYMLRRNRGTVVLVALLGAVGGFLMTLASPRIYQARTTLEIQGYNNDFLNMGSVSPTMADAGYDAVADIQTHVRVLQSRTMLERAAKRLEGAPAPTDLQPPDRLGMWRRALDMNPPTQEALYDQAVGTAAGSVSARTSGVNRIVEVTCDSTSGQVAADFCNTLTQQYIDQNLESRWQSTEYTGQWLTKQLQDLKVKLEQSQDELQAYLRQSGLIVSASGQTESGERANVQEVRLADLLKELSTAQTDRIAKQSRYEMGFASSPEGLPEVMDDSPLRSSQDALLQLQTKLAQLSVTFTPNHSEVRRVRAEIAAIESSMQVSRVEILRHTRTEYEAAQRREALLQAEYVRQAGLVSGQAEQMAHYNLLKREVDASRMLYDTLLQRTKEASVASALRANNIRIIDPALRPGGPHSPNVVRQVLIGLLFGLVAGVGLVVVRERSDCTLQDPGDIAHYLGVAELGVIPVGELAPKLLASNGSRPPSLLRLGETDANERVEMVVWHQKSSLLAESFRTTLTSILFSRHQDDRPRVLVFTSASPKEGKTTTVCNLGIALAEISHRVLLIDADLRRPRLHNVFGLRNDLGLSDLLLQKTPLDARTVEEACVATRIPGLFVLPSGSSSHSSSSLLHSARLNELLALARGQFDTVAIDTPPMVNLADARVVARLADGLIIVVRSGTTTRDAALLATSRFAEDGIPILGSILNYWNPKLPGYSHHRYYYSGYENYYGDGGSDDDASGSPPEEKKSSLVTIRFGRQGRAASGPLQPETNRSARTSES